ncbi:MAG: RNA 2',3'-cyclic phosphodiesterase [Anaerolineales bacterium]|nr:RNA 2',3'-cyclic phosphodiesterase [Anaerolineales bacterium]
MRLFVAIDLSTDLRAKLRDQITVLQDFLDTKSVRWVNPDSVHLTLKFLGETPSHRLGEIIQTIEPIAADHSIFEMEVGGFGCFPNIKKPRVLWTGISEQSGVLQKLKSELELGCRKLGYEAENRPFKPHLTLGRVRRQARSAERRELAEKLVDVSIGDLGIEKVDAFYLFKSDLKPTGAVYTKQATFQLVGD